MPRNGHNGRRLAGAILMASAIGLLAAGGVWLGRDSRIDPGIDPPGVARERVFEEVYEAVEAARSDVLARPDSGQAWGQLGRVLLAHERFDEADIAFQQAHRFEPRQVVWIYLRGVTHEPVDPDLARSLFQQAHALAPRILPIRLTLADVNLRLGDIEQAEQLLADVSLDQSENYRVLYLKARCHELKDEFPNAIALAERAWELQPEQAQIGELLATLHQKSGDAAKALESLELIRSRQAVRRTWDDPYLADVVRCRRDPHWLAATAADQARMGQPELAVTVLTRLVSQHPEVVEFREQWITLLVELGEFEQARQAAQDAVARFPSHPVLWVVNGVALDSLKRFAESEVMFREAIRLKPGDAVAHYYLGESLRHQGRIDEARAALRRARHLDPTLKEAAAAIQQIDPGTPP